MAFSISFLDAPLEYLEDDPAIPSAIGKIVIGNFEEEFASSLFEWSRTDYEGQWRNAVQAILHGESKAALIVEYISPLKSNKLVWWPMYRFGESIHIQNHILFFDQHPEVFSLDRAFSFLPDCRETNEDRVSISTWTTSLADLRNFAAHSTGLVRGGTGESE